MNDNNTNTCPVCFTKMRKIQKVLTCPECGYKYCDHNRDREDLFDTSHTHEPNYTTYTNNTPSTTYTDTPNTNTYTPKTNTSSGGTSSASRGSQKSVAKVVKIIVIIYIIMMFCPFICSALGTIITTFGNSFLSGQLEELNEYEGQEITINVTPEAETPVDIDAILSNIEVTADPSPVTIEYEDGEFVTELIKHIFEVNDCTEVSDAEFRSIYWLEIYKRPDGLYANYYFNDGGAGTFDSDITDMRNANLNAFVDLELLDSLDITYAEGDLKDLKALNGLSCKSTPAGLINVISSPKQLIKLHLNLPSVSDTLEGLQYFTELQTLEISAQNASVSDASLIGSLDQLNTLSYTDAGDLRDFSFLSYLPSLNCLTLNALSLTDLNFVRDLPELQSLSFYGSDVTDLEPLTDAADTLTTLDMSFNTFVTDYSPLNEMTELKYLSMDYCELTNISFLSKLENLSELSICNNQITSLEPVKNLPNLTYIQAFGNSIEDYAGLEYLTAH